MIYCQDCGAGNDPSNPTCRVCGRALQFQRSTLRCSACRELVGIGAAFCSNCGASCDDLPLGAVAEGGTPPNEAAIDALLVASAPAAARETVAAPPPAADNFNVGAGLDLPDWLKRAAAGTPHDPSALATAGGSPGQDLAARVASGAGPAAPAVTMTPSSTGTSTPPAADVAPPAPPAAPVAPAESAGADVPLPPLPDGGLSSTLPAWLRPGTGPAAAGPAAAPPPPVLPAGRSLADDPADTSSFISENDLPDWLRQLAAAEAAQAEETRRADEATRLAAARVADAETAPPAQAPPDEVVQTAGTSGVAGRWLARHDFAGDAGSGRRSAFADVIEERLTEQEANAEAAPPIAAGSAPGSAHPSWMTAAPPETQAPSAKSSRNAKRWLLIAVLLLAIAALVAYLFVGGQFG